MPGTAQGRHTTPLSPLRIKVPRRAERLAGFHGSQCGFCTPGMVVACHAMLTACKARGQAPTDAVMEKGLDGNICRCTGYRSIMDACKVRRHTSHP